MFGIYLLCQIACVLENMFLIIDDCTCVFVCLEFTYCVSTLGNGTALGFVPLKVGYGAMFFLLFCLCLCLMDLGGNCID